MATRRILVVGDPDATGALVERLAVAGHGMAFAASGDRALAAAEQSAPDLVLVAAAPTGAVPADVADTLVRRYRVPLLLVGDEGDRPAPAAAGAAVAPDFLALPFTDRELALAMELALCRHDATLAVRELEGFFSTSIELFCFLDFNGYFRRLNPAWERILGFSLEELKSRPFIEFVHPDDRKRTLAQNARVRAGGEAKEFENRYLCRDGSYRWLHWNAASRAAGLIYSVARDVTERKRAEEERAQLTRTLEASLAEVRTLQGILPICMYCKQIRDDEDYWQTVETYISRHTDTRFSHGICPNCMDRVVEPELKEMEDG